MLVVMKAGSTTDDIESIACRAAEAGHRVERFDSLQPGLLYIAGDNADDAAAWIERLPSVERVAPSNADAAPVTSNLRIAGIRPLVPPAILQEQLELSADGARSVHQSRRELVNIMNGDDDRMLVVVGPCSIHDAAAAIDYAERLARLSRELENELRIVMRVYFEKPRTTVGWKGLINDPNLDGSFAVNDGLRIARQLLLDVIALGLPAGCEFLDPITPQFISDLVSWGAIGARTTESQVHRNLSSGLSMPIGFKNGTSGDIQIAIDAMKAASFPHQFMSVTEQGVAAIVVTRGNRDTHIILRGGSTGTNFDPESVQSARAGLSTNKLPARVMIDASHGNSSKDFRRQPVVVESVSAQIESGETGIFGVMLESFLVDGRQELTGAEPLTYGQSVTDACMGWDMTVPALMRLAKAVQTRRATK